MFACQEIALKPTKAQVAVFRSNANAARIARNDLIVLWREEGKRLPGFRYTKKERRPVCNGVKHQLHPWFHSVSQNAVKGGYIDAEDAIARYHSGQNRRPRLHGPERPKRFRADNGPGTVQMIRNRLKLPQLAGGSVKCHEELRWTGKEVRECRIKEKGGRWYSAVRVSITEAEYGKLCGHGVAALDSGVETFVTVCHLDGRTEKIPAPQPYKAALKTLRRRSREVSRRKKGGKNRAKSQVKLQKAHARVSNIRKDFLHKLSDALTAEAAAVVIEDLNLKGWQKLWGRKASDQAVGEFLRQLEYKAEWKGCELVKAPWNFPSSQICSNCGVRDGKKDLSVRRWTCPHCEEEHDRDENAAVNLLNYGRQLAGDCPRSECKTLCAVRGNGEVGTDLRIRDYAK